MIRPALAALLVAVAVAAPRPAGAAETLRLAMYAPAVPFTTSDQAQSYLDGLAAAIAEATGREVRGRVYFRYSDLARARPHLAVIDARCVVAMAPGKVIASAVVGGKTSRSWGLYARDARALAAVKGARIAHDTSGCRDRDFMSHALLASELELGFFGPLIGKPTAAAAAAAVTDSKVAKAAFLPASAGKSLRRVLIGARVPTPALVAMRPLAKRLRAQVKRAVVGYRGVVISGWRGEGYRAYRDLASRMKPQSKTPLLAPPATYRLRAGDIVRIPPGDRKRPGLRHHLQ